MLRESFKQLASASNACVSFTVSSVILFTGMTASAQTSTPLAQPTEDEYSRIYLGAENQAYRDVVDPNWFPVINFGAQTHRYWNEYEVKADFDLRVGARNPKAFAPTAQNAYIGEPDNSTASPLRFSFGRRLVLWNQMDEMWNLGNIQPMDAWDRMRPRSQGLTGIFAYTETQKLSFRIFLSYVALPQMDPNVVLENNNFENVHPQSTVSTPRTITFLNKTTPLGYHLQLPSADKILFRPSFGFMVETKPDLPVLGRFMYGYLPLNYFPLAINAPFNVAINQVVIDVHPRLVQHHVYSGDVGYKILDPLTVGFSGMVDQPTPESFPTNYDYTPLSTSYSSSPWAKLELNRHVKFTVSHLFVNGGVNPDIGDPLHINPDRSLYSSHIYYRSASMIGANLLPVEDQSAEFFLKYIHEYSIEADWVAADVIFRTENHWNIVFGGDLINAKKDYSPNRGAEFLADLKALDRLRVGVTYVF